jgi:ankyrin repeat protein
MRLRALLLASCCAALCAGVDLRAQSENSLIEAIRAGDTQAARALLKQRALVNRAEPDGTTPLHWAARMDDLSLVQALLRAGANPNATNRYGSVPLELAAVNGSAAVVDALLQAGADPKVTLADGETLLMTASRTGRVDAMRLLLARGIDVNAQERWLGETALIWAAAENHADAVRVLAEAGASLNTTAKKLQFPRKISGQTTLPVGGMTALMYAARQGAADAVRALVELGADLNVQDADGTSAMVLAIINGHYDIAVTLVEKGADSGVADSVGMAALYAAVDMNTAPYMHGRPAPKPSGRYTPAELVKVLLDHRADPNQRLKTATLRRHNSAGIQSLGEGTTPLMRAAYSGDVPLMRVLLAHGADPKLTQKNGTTLVMLSAGFGRRGDHNADSQEFERGTPEELLQSLKLCVELGLDVTTANEQGDTALHVAAGAEIVRYLVEHGARLDVTNKRNHTPLDAALARVDKSDRQLRPDAVAALRELGGVTGKQLSASSPKGSATRATP